MVKTGMNQNPVDIALMCAGKDDLKTNKPGFPKK
jgi:hypothetical protein